MNIFEEYDGIIGTVDVDGLRRSLKEFFDLASTIRQMLGARAYLLDKYISYLLEQANHTLCYQIADEGFGATGELGRLYHEVEKGSRASQDHPLYEKTTATFRTHPLPYQEHNTQFEILKVAMFSDGLEYMVEAYAKEQRDRLRGAADIIHVRQLYDEISQIVGAEALMEQLNEVFRRRFLSMSMLSVYAHSATNDLLYALTSRDMETSKQVFQLILDHGFPVAEGGADNAQDA